MLKRYEVFSPESCLNRAKPDEMLFVLLDRDVAAAATIRFWVGERLRLGKNQSNDPQILEAEGTATAIEIKQRRGAS